MQVLIYNDIEVPSTLKKQFDKVIDALQKNDFKTPEIKKMVNTGFYRAKLDDKNRLLFRFGKHNDEKYIFVTEVISNHNYAASRFLRGAVADEKDFTPLSNPDLLREEELIQVPFVNRKSKHFNILDKMFK